MKKLLPLCFFLSINFTISHAQVTDTIGAGGSLEFNSDGGNYVDLGLNYKTLTFPFTIEAWIYPTGLPGLNGGIFSQDNSAVYYGWQMLETPSGTLDIFFGNGQGWGPPYRRGFVTINSIPLNQWTHVAIECNSVTDVIMYFNGVLQAIVPDDGTSTDTAFTHSPDGVAAIGQAWTSTSRAPFIGQIDEVRLWSDSVSQTTIQTNMCKKINPNTPGLLGYWRADEADNSNTVYDYTSNHINGTFVGTVSREISDAPLGNSSAYLYPSDWSDVTLKVGSTIGDTLAASQISGNPDGVQVYVVNSKPYYTTGLQFIDKSYFGVFCVNGYSPNCTVTCRYSLKDGIIDSINRDSVSLYVRTDATDVPWTSLQVSDTLNQTVIKTNQGSPREYILNIRRDLVYLPDACLSVMLPTAFTPGKEANSIFHILNIGNVSLQEFRIYNRWGQLIFQTNDINSGWDGTFNGKPQPLDVYVYYAKLLCEGKTVFLKGNVTLIR